MVFSEQRFQPQRVHKFKGRTIKIKYQIFAIMQVWHIAVLLCPFQTSTVAAPLKSIENGTLLHLKSKTIAEGILFHEWDSDSSSLEDLPVKEERFWLPFAEFFGSSTTSPPFAATHAQVPIYIFNAPINQPCSCNQPTIPADPESQINLRPLGSGAGGTAASGASAPGSGSDAIPEKAVEATETIIIVELPSTTDTPTYPEPPTTTTPTASKTTTVGVIPIESKTTTVPTTVPARVERPFKGKETNITDEVEKDDLLTKPLSTIPDTSSNYIGDRKFPKLPTDDSDSDADSPINDIGDDETVVEGSRFAGENEEPQEVSWDDDDIISDLDD